MRHSSTSSSDYMPATKRISNDAPNGAPASAAESPPITPRALLRSILHYRSLARLAIFWLCLEVVARLAPWIVPQTVHQPFAVSTSTIDPLSDGQGPRSVTWIANERGARGNLSRGQALQIATLGTSTTAGSMLDQTENWPEQLQRAFPCLHVDNFARDGATLADTANILRELEEDGRRYSAIFVMHHGDVSPRRRADSLWFWGQWSNRSTALAGPSLAVTHLARQAKTEPRVADASRWILNTFLRQTPSAPNDRSNWLRRRSGQVTFVYEPQPVDAEEAAQIRDLSREMLEIADRVADRVFVLAQPVGYDERAVDGVGERWVELYPAEREDGAYLDNRAVAEGFRARIQLIADEGHRGGHEVVDLDGAMRPMLRRRGDLFLDKWHPSREGAAVIGELLAPVLRRAGIRCTEPHSIVLPNPALREEGTGGRAVAVGSASRPVLVGLRAPGGAD